MKRIISLLIISFGLISFSTYKPKDYPIPENRKDLLFYIQRNHNKNTIIYDANFDEKGNLLEKNPMDVYWIRYEENGQRMELRYIEKIFAYGGKCKKIETKENQYIVKIVADENKEFWLIQKSPFEASIYTLINDKYSQLEHLYVNADNSGFWPTVKYIELFGKEVTTGNINYERVNIK